MQVEPLTKLTFNTFNTTSSGFIADDTERGHIDSPIYQSSVEKHAVQFHKVVADEMLDDNMDQKMQIFDVKGLEDKYLNTIFNRSCSPKILNCDTQSYEAWKVQSDFNFGFIPMGEFQLSESQEIHEMSHYCPIKAHFIVKQYQKPNYLGTRLKVDSQLNLQAWENYLSDYWDRQLIDLLYFGFPLDFNRNCPLKWEGVNHNSAINHPNDIEVYLREELAHKAIVGPLKEHPCPDGHISPLLTSEKPNSNNRRVIVDLSWTLGLSVNGGVHKNSYLGTDFSLHLPTIDHITDQLKLLGRGCHLYKIDISRAFRHIKVDYNILGLSWHDVYVDTCNAFGSRHGFQIFQRCSDAIRFIMKKMGHKIIGYIDDYVGFGVPSDAKASFDCLYDLLQELGLTISSKTLIPPSTVVTCLGIEVNTKKGTLRTTEKMVQISDMLQSWKGKKFCTKRQLQSLLGHLLYIHKCVKPTRYFLNRMLEVLRDAHNATHISLNPAFHRDLRWFLTFHPDFNGVPLYDHKKVAFQVHLDACLQGLGGVFNNLVYHVPIPLGF